MKKKCLEYLDNALSNAMLRTLSGIRHVHPELNWIERLTTDQKAWGSNPYGCAIFFLSN